MRRYAIMTEYDGTVFSGWQRQQNAPSVQAAMENKIGRASCRERV